MYSPVKRHACIHWQISVYSIRSLEDNEGSMGALVEELCAARKKGVAVAVATDKGQADGEGSFAGGDYTLTPLRLWRCGIATYKCKNYAGHYTAMHHKNALFGLKKRLIIWTDTGAHKHVHRHAYRHVYGHVYRHACTRWQPTGRRRRWVMVRQDLSHRTLKQR